MSEEAIGAAVAAAERFRRDAYDLLGNFENTPYRVLSLSETRRQVEILNLKQTELLEESLLAMQHGLYRSAIVLGWAAFMDFLHERLAEDEFGALHAKYPKWRRWSTIEEIRENVSEHSMLEVARKLGLLTKAELKALHGLLSKRNECAHPSGYKPVQNEALGFVSELLNRIPTISQRSA